MLDLKLSDEPIYALGVYFSYKEELATEKNFFDKLNPLKKLLNIWSSRDLSIYRRINIVKTLAISKLTFICSVLDTPNGFTDEVNNIIFRYIWKNKNPKLKKTTITRSKNDGGLGMIDFSLFDKALKISWVKRLCSKETEPWKSIPLSLLSNVGGKLFFECNYDIKSLCINEHLPKFYRDIILHWQDLNRTTPEKTSFFLASGYRASGDAKPCFTPCGPTAREKTSASCNWSRTLPPASSQVRGNSITSRQH